MSFAVVIRCDGESHYTKPLGASVHISKAYLEISEPLKDGETITLLRNKPSLGGGVTCARFNKNRDEVSLDLTFPVEKKYTLFVGANDHPSARIHLTGSFIVEPSTLSVVRSHMHPLHHH
ncbi:hypothetical protein DAPPUDRAFT_321850 [Daphnia pulex]|uniref:Nucleoplasmin-like domain-containing protein n=1 Tax=Daphnia pulex TaxID=6669 RepID=E9GU37_DAPPU|nr:hypothetical protein DAPPUDRAFT_321850 [Daphnia pulex]|eukprot:EFX76970.1 hypothetical protein DAPPUDRAFT_321850 [Daphnia pulex]